MQNDDIFNSTFADWNEAPWLPLLYAPRFLSCSVLLIVFYSIKLAVCSFDGNWVPAIGQRPVYYIQQATRMKMNEKQENNTQFFYSIEKSIENVYVYTRII